MTKKKMLLSLVCGVILVTGCSFSKPAEGTSQTQKVENKVIPMDENKYLLMVDDDLDALSTVVKGLDQIVTTCKNIPNPPDEFRTMNKQLADKSEQTIETILVQLKGVNPPQKYSADHQNFIKVFEHAEKSSQYVQMFTRSQNSDALMNAGDELSQTTSLLDTFPTIQNAIKNLGSNKTNEDQTNSSNVQSSNSNNSKNDQNTTGNQSPATNTDSSKQDSQNDNLVQFTDSGISISVPESWIKTKLSGGDWGGWKLNDPTDPNKQIILKTSGCIGCIMNPEKFAKGISEPDPYQVVPSLAVEKFKFNNGLSAGYSYFDTNNPFKVNGVVKILDGNSGYTRLEVYLPDNEKDIASKILNSLQEVK